VGVPDLGIQLMAEKGIVGRGVLLDAKRYFEARGEPLDPFTMRRFTPDDLDAIAASQRTALQPGDMLLLYTGWAETWVNTPPDLRPRRRGTPGIAQSQAMLAWIWDHQVALFAADNGGLEASPVDPDSGFISPDEPAPARGATHNGMLHRQMIALLGLAIGELWKLDALAEDCAADRRYEMLLTAKPLNVLGGVGSPPNALAIK
jgi:kynurenine formamidase